MQLTNPLLLKMDEQKPIKRDDKLFASCYTCGEVASWIPYKEGGEWECHACRTGTRQYGRADREKYLREKMSPQERRKPVILTAVRVLALALGAWITWELFRSLATVG
jgi:hypothetical protein